MNAPHDLTAPSTTRVWLRRIGFTVFTLAALPILFYAIENIRGNSAWNNARAELEAKGEKIEWKDFVPPPIPDDQNMLKAPLMAEWFLQKGNGAPAFLEGELKSLESEKLYGEGPFLIARFVFVADDGTKPESTPPGTFRWEDLPLVTGKLSKVHLLLPDHLLSYQLTLGRTSPVQPPPAPLVIHAATIPSLAELTESFENVGLWDGSSHTFEAGAEANTFNLMARNTENSVVFSARDYLDATSRFSGDCDLIRAAARRPLASWEPDVERPLARTGANFLRVIHLCYLGIHQASAHLLLHEPDQAMAGLELVEAARRILQAPPLLLINKSVERVLLVRKAEVMHQGLRAGLWSDAHLLRFQTAFAAENQPALLAASLRAERAADCHHLLTATPHELAADAAVSLAGIPWNNPRLLFAQLSPQGWRKQNMANLALAQQGFMDMVDAREKRIHGERLRENQLALGERLGGHSPYAFWLQEPLGEVMIQVQTTAHAQTVADLGVLACALERHRLATGAMPESLDALVPKYCDKLPHQVVNGNSFHYRVEKDGGATVWSEGWNLSDDGGKISPYEGFSSHGADDWGWRIPGHRAK